MMATSDKAMSQGVSERPLRILVLGDSYCPASALRPAFTDLAKEHTIDFGDVTDDGAWQPTTPSELGLHEYLGTPTQVIAHLARHDVLVVQGAPVTDEAFDACPTLRLVCCARGGPVNIDVRAATERGIPVVTTPGKNADAVADLTLGLMVMLARRLGDAVRFIDSGAEFGHDNYEGARWFGHDLAGQTLGLVGYGQVGRRVAERALAFDLQVLVFDPYVAPETIRAPGIEPCDLAGLLGRSDFVSLHARLTPDDRGLLGPREFAAMREGAYLINTARHELVDEAALEAAMAAGRLGGLALDVATASPERGRHPLLSYRNVVILPHLGGSTAETLRHGGEMAAADIERFVTGAAMRNVANRAALAARIEPAAVP
jgi:D-3-phosphoglycerate dehydrogenase / 2-oxoglutarate reductase